jgi:hypothetical protein
VFRTYYVRRTIQRQRQTTRRTSCQRRGTFFSSQVRRERKLHPLEVLIAVCKTLGTAATSLLFEHNTRARVFGLFLDNHCMDPLHSLIKSEPFYCVQVLVTKKVQYAVKLLSQFLYPSREVFELLHNSETLFRQIVHTRDIIHPPQRS